MTINERIKSIIANPEDIDMSYEQAASAEKMIYIAYWIGREAAAREVSDAYNRHLSAQHERAAQCRYNRMAAAVVGPESYIYSADYSQEMTATFGGDPADI